jgi:hypothetical protein
MTTMWGKCLKTTSSDVPPPDQDVNILCDVWSILVLVNYSAALDHRHCISSLVLSASDIWWFATWSWRHGLSRRCDTAQQTTTIRRHTKWPQQEEGEKLTCCAWENMEMSPDTLEAVGVNELFVVVTERYIDTVTTTNSKKIHRQ